MNALVGASYLISATTVSCRIGQQVWLGEGCSFLAETFSFNFLGFSDSKEVKKAMHICFPKFDIMMFILKRCGRSCGGNVEVSKDHNCIKNGSTKCKNDMPIFIL